MSKCVTHFTGCECHEFKRDQDLQIARHERDAAILEVRRLQARFDGETDWHALYVVTKRERDVARVEADAFRADAVAAISMRMALTFYADDNNYEWEQIDDENPTGPIMEDGGARARAALNGRTRSGQMP